MNIICFSFYLIRYIQYLSISLGIFNIFHHMYNKPDDRGPDFHVDIEDGTLLGFGDFYPSDIEDVPEEPPPGYADHHPSDGQNGPAIPEEPPLGYADVCPPESLDEFLAQW